MPRRYTLRTRADDLAATRARIVAATMAIYRDEGPAAATTPAIARAADVSPGTVRNHFPDRDDLARAVADLVLEEIKVPDVGIFDGLDSVTDRVDRLARELAAFSSRSEVWWQVRGSDPGLVAAWAGHERAFDDRLTRLVEAAVGRDPTLVAVVRTVVGSPLFYTLRGAGLSADAAVEVELSLVIPWLEGRLAPHRGARPGHGGGRRSVPPSRRG